ncbi:MAG: MBL fold metallo-hydrolase, partial [Staphylococcus equorum]
MNLSFHGQSTIYFEANGKKVIVDPFITGNGQSDLDANAIEVDYIILTHGHGDHFGDTVELANRNNATVIGSAELGDYLTTNKNVENVRPMNIGGKAEFEFGTVKFV